MGGDAGDNNYLTKIMTGNQWEGLKYWLLNIIEQNMGMEQFRRVLQYLPRTLEQFLHKQWHEIPTQEQLDQLVFLVLEHCGLNEVPPLQEVEAKHAPVLKIRGLVWRS